MTAAKHTITVKEQEFFYRQNDSFENSGGNTFFIAMDVIRKGEKVKQYTSFPSYQEYISWEKKFKPSERIFYEQIKFDSPCWEYYDIDDWADKSITPKQLYNEFINHRIEFGNSLNLETQRSKFTVLDSSKIDAEGNLIKGSLHILSHNISFPNNGQHKEFFQKFIAYLPSEFPKLDGCVYSKNRVFRLENNTKIGEFRPLKKPLWLIETGMFHKPVEYLITVNVDPSLYWTLDQQTINERQRIKEERKIALEKLPRIDGLENIFDNIVSYIKEGKHSKGDERFNCALLGYANWIKFVYAVKGALGMEFVEKHWDEIYYLYGNASESCCQSQLTSIINAEIETDTTSLMFWAKQIPKFQEEHPEHFNALNTIELPQEIKYEECEVKKVNGFESVSYIDLLNKYDTVFVRGNMGCGKTEKLSSLFLLYEKIAFVSSKRSLGYDFKNKHPEFELYDDLKGTIDTEKHNKIIVQVDSLHRVIGELELLIVDEAIDLSSQMLSSRNKTQSMDAFIDYLEISKKRIIMDANLNRIDFFKLIINLENAIFIKDTKVYHTDKHIIEYRIEDKELFIKNILEIDNGRMFIPSDSKKFIDTISAQYMKDYPERKVLVLTSDSPYEDRREDWDNYDVIFCSPTITAGVSHKTKIDYVFGYYTKRSINAWAATQQMLRCRNWKEANVYFGNAKGNEHLPVNDEDIEKWIDDRFLTEIEDFQGFKINRIKKGVEKNFMYYTYFEDLKIMNRSKKFFRYYFLKIMGEHGIKVKKIIIDAKINYSQIEEIKTQSKLTEIENKQAFINAIMTAEPTQQDMIHFKANKFDKINKATLEVILMKETYGFCPRTEDEIKTYIGKRKVYKNICKTVQNLDNPIELSCSNYSHLEIKEQNDIQRRTVCNIMIREAGFNGLLDKNTITINENLKEFVNKNVDKIQTVFNSNKKVELKDNRALIKFVNSKLEDVYGVKFVGKDKKSKGVRFQVYTIDGLDIWSEKQGEGKPCITNKLQSLLRL